MFAAVGVSLGETADHVLHCNWTVLRLFRR